MIERCERFGLALKAGEALGVHSQRLRQDLEGDLALQGSVPRPIDLTHAASTQGAGELIGAEARAWLEGHAVGTSKLEVRPAPMDRERSHGHIAITVVLTP
jgi:hypothetical protein